MKKLTLKKFIHHLKYLAQERKSVYRSTFPYNSMYIHEDGVLSADCIGMIKGLINWHNIWKKTSPVGFFCPVGRRIPDWGEYEIYAHCTGRSQDFSVIDKGAYMEMDELVGHAGIFVGRFRDSSGVVNTIECTTDFGGGIRTSYVDSRGRRYDHKGGTFTGLRWERYGYLTKWVKY